MDPTALPADQMTPTLAAAPGPASRDHIQLTTVGIDIGSSTSHLTFSLIQMQRLGDSLSSRYVPVERTILYQSDITFTPYLPDDTIDAEALAEFVRQSYARAAIRPAAVDSGAVILTGEAVKRRNARAINQQLADIAGSFVSMAAGPHLEAIIAAHGSGAVRLSRTRPTDRVLNVDIGGGTTKFAIVNDGRIERTGALSVGGRLIATRAPADRVVVRVEEAGSWFAERVGAHARLGDVLDDGLRERIAASMAEVVAEVVSGRGPGASGEHLWVTPPFELTGPPDRIVVSGGVAEYVLGHQSADFGDLGQALGAAFKAELDTRGLWGRVAASVETIRATVIGASQYTVQVSGNTVAISDSSVVPFRNLRVVSPPVTFPLDPPDADTIAGTILEHLRRHGLDVTTEPFGLAFAWRGAPFHPNLHALALGVVLALHRLPGSNRPLVLLFDSDVAQSIGELISAEIDWEGPMLSLDGLVVDDFDFVDIGARIEPAGTYPVVVKSLVYPPAPSERDRA